METEGSSYYTEMEKLGREMVRRCKGLPLAVLVLRGFMVTKHSLPEWERVYNRLNSYRGAKKLAQVNKEVSTVLSFSYGELPYKFKPCFLYLANFRGFGYNKTEELYEMWISDGLIWLEDRKEGETMMDVAKRYMRELEQRSMVQNIEDSEYWKLHDVMRELCMSKAEEDKFTKRMDFTLKGQEALESLSINTDAYRLSLHLDKNAFNRIVTSETETSRLRFLQFTKQQSGLVYETLKWPTEAWHFNEFKFLRVLRIVGYDFGDGNILEGIGQLIHLRCLCFEDCNSEKVPSSIGNLVYLEVVILDLGYDLEIQNIIWKSKRLYHLSFPYIHKSKHKLHLNSFLNLEILENFNPESCQVKDLFNLTCLRKLSICIDGNLEGLAVLMSYLASISSKHLSLFHLKVYNCNFDSEEGETLLRQLFECNRVHKVQIAGPLSKLPGKNINVSHSLIRLFLDNCELEENPLTTLENFPNLETLHLWNNAFLGKEMTCSKTGFPKLKYFCIWGLKNLENLIIDEGGMPTLRNIQIHSCVKLEMLPEGLRFITSLNHITVDHMPETFKRRVQVIDGHEGEDFYKVRHLPLITTYDDQVFFK